MDSREFLDPCKAIATLQIARDLRNDSAVQLSSMLKGLPEDIQKLYKGDEVPEELDAAMIRDCSIRMPSKLLDINLEDEIQTIQTFRDIVKKQKIARQQLIHLLIKSRCQFGSNDAAKEFFDLADKSKKLRQRQVILGDALELEGLDNEIVTTDYGKELDGLAKLGWYKPDEGENQDGEETAESAAKKARIE